MDTIFFQKEKIGLNLPEFRNQTIFYCVLNWGIGHATRSIPIIKHYLALGNKIILFSDGEAENVLKKSFPELTIHTLPSYKIKYAAHRFLFLLIALQSLTRFWVIWKENRRLKRYAVEYQPSIVISDNRYGGYLSNTKNFLITHQLKLVTNNWLENISQSFIDNLIKPFDQLWIPDIEGVNLSGEMIHASVQKSKRWIGFPSIKMVDNDEKYKSDILILLSGPEPRRSELEQEYLKIIPHLNKKICFIAGNFSQSYKEYQTNNLQFYSYLPYEQTLNYIRQANVVVCRSGYSTLIDLYILQKQNIICIPTAGQPEQEYLAKYWADKGWIKSMEEKELPKRLAEEINRM